ncbi:SH3 domain-containing protein C23A1.17 [Psilocybe cubensis]|uniref:SH3 domain-containing protein C23A1.17 n=2 Tax=Psilocybe cubensis TaxID=181762 RepID=A0ACB8GQG9_PSICU|nr:SH3 domain-containing protein C23A1.17 [Psilocybe cubensis]KAH9477662.1 SH3 domain-containing protein C23A1.17 [Psilocybe cubensis]
MSNKSNKEESNSESEEQKVSKPMPQKKEPKQNQQEVSKYEATKQKNIEQNKVLLRELGLDNIGTKMKKGGLKTWDENEPTSKKDPSTPSNVHTFPRQPSTSSKSGVPNVEKSTASVKEKDLGDTSPQSPTKANQSTGVVPNVVNSVLHDNLEDIAGISIATTKDNAKVSIQVIREVNSNADLPRDNDLATANPDMDVDPKSDDRCLRRDAGVSVDNAAVGIAPQTFHVQSPSPSASPTTLSAATTPAPPPTSTPLTAPPTLAATADPLTFLASLDDNLKGAPSFLSLNVIQYLQGLSNHTSWQELVSLYLEFEKGNPTLRKLSTAMRPRKVAPWIKRHLNKKHDPVPVNKANYGQRFRDWWSSNQLRGCSSQEEGGQQQQPSQTISPPEQSTPSLSVSGSEEILDKEEGDPIDPAFHSPSRQTSFVNLRSISQAQEEIDAQSPISPSIGRSSLVHSPVVAPPAAPPSAAPHDDDDAKEDVEQLRRKTIAERMAKLGGIRFGAAPIPTPISRPPPRQSEEEDQKEGESSAAVDEEPAVPLSEEEEERARKERIAAKLATMGGMRIGMMMGAGGLPPLPPRLHMVKEENVDRASAPAPAVPPAPPTRAVPLSRPPPPPAAPVQSAQDTDSEYGSVAASEEGVKVEAGESEAEESGYEHVEEAPPPVPSRAACPSINRQSTGPSSPPSRPPVPTALPMRRSSTLQSSTSTRNVSGGDGASSPPHRAPQMPHTEYVMVEEPESQEAPPPPPARPAARPPPSRSAPQAPQPPPMLQRPDLGDSISLQWELPSIPNSSLDFSGASDLTMSWTDAGAEPTSPVVAAQPSSPPAPPPPTKPPAPLANNRQLSADELIALWGRVGVQVCKVATSLFEKSHKTLIGDGSYAGFVREVLAAVPNAAPAPTAAGEPYGYTIYGYTIYVQNGPAVVKRVSDIMPGNLVEIQDAKLKGHKGLQTYHQSVGAAGETLVGVVGEFEAKKSKIRVFQANQHVGQQTVESVSYRLEDLKSGLVKVYRVLDA